MRDKTKRSDKCGILFEAVQRLTSRLLSATGIKTYTYAKGYKDAADFIVQGAIGGSRHFNFQINELVFQLCFSIGGM